MTAKFNRADASISIPIFIPETGDIVEQQIEIAISAPLSPGEMVNALAITLQTAVTATVRES
jgi:hypothetical protein